MRNFKMILTSFLSLNLLISLPIYFFKNELFNTAFVTLIFYSLLWIVLEICNENLAKKRDEKVMTTFVLFIGVKFLVSLLFMLFLYLNSLVSNIPECFLVMIIYTIYTFLMLKNNLILEPIKKP